MDYGDDDYGPERRWFPNALFGRPAVEVLVVFGSILAGLALFALARSTILHGGTPITVPWQGR